MKTLHLILILGLASGNALADVYKCVVDGKVEYLAAPKAGCAGLELKDTLSSPEELQRQKIERERKMAEEQRQESAQAEEREKQAQQQQVQALLRAQRAQLEMQRRQLRAAEEANKPYWITPFYDDRDKPPPGFRALPKPQP